MADLTAKTSWTPEEAAHFARRAGFGISPEAATALAGQPIGAAVTAWVEGTGLDPTLFDSVWADRADPVWLARVGRDTGVAGSVDVPAEEAPHRYKVDGADAWRNDLGRAQASWLFRMQYHPHAFAERMALFHHNLFATGYEKVQSTALMLQHVAMLRRSAGDLRNFEDLLVAVSKDPAMALWLDSVRNRADGNNVPNENYAREVMELYSLGADNGYSQDDITKLALALSGWSYVVTAAQRVANPARPTSYHATAGTFRVYDGTAIPAGTYRWDDLDPTTPPTTVPNRHVNATRGAITFLEQPFDVSAVPAGSPADWVPGEDALRSIIRNRGATSRRPRCAEFLAKRILTHFVTSRFTAQDLADVAARIQALEFDLRAVLVELFQSVYFHDPQNRFALVEGPVSWMARAARALGMPLSAADAATPKGFPAWAQVAGSLDAAGMKLLDPAGPNGWKEDAAWMNSTTARTRGRVAAAIALGETFTQGSGSGNTYQLFPTAVDGAAGWFPSAPADPTAVFDRLVALLQPAPIAPAVRDAWLGSLWPTGSTFAWDAAGQKKARQLAFLILCSPSGQRY